MHGFCSSLGSYLSTVLFVGTEPLVSTMGLPHVMAARDSSEEV